ncbi:alpha/beta fold hydrolase [Sphingomonas endolithica]|uniref:alpha/beta fold hydrolase n=1 Tax=Sphingomonas endolithica TaxID=2972485 RepID=UPI0021AF54B3|nr:alpha/beta hydrolase [Sphingomonas sp. ZFBP2030]
MTIDTPVPGTTRFLDMTGGRLAYDDTGGDGELILAIPGMGDLRGAYRHLRPALVAAGYRLVTMDVRGFGETTAGWDDYSARAVGHDALALINALGAADAVILGNSFAAGSALWAARDAPTRVRGVVLLGPIVRDLAIAPTVMLAFQVGFGGPWRHEFWTAYWDALFITHRPVDHADYRARLLKNIAEPGRMDALMAMLTLSKADTAAIVAESDVPALVVMGSRDPDFDDPTEEAVRLATMLSAGSLIVGGVGHYPHLETPEAVAAAIAPFLGSLPMPARRQRQYCNRTVQGSAH